MRARAGHLFRLYAERYASAQPPQAAGILSPLRARAKHAPAPKREGWVEARRAKKVAGMARTFRIDTAANPTLLLERVRRVASENGVTLFGNESSGHFSHKMLEGDYRRLGRTVIVTITYKHRLVPWSVLESRLRGLFGSGPSGIPPVHQRSTAGAARRRRGPRRASLGPPHHHRHPHRRRPPHRR